MALPNSGLITLGMVNEELKKGYNTPISLGDSDVRTLAQKPSGVISMSDLHGKSAELTPETCDYYFKDVDDFDDRIDGILNTHNADLSDVTLGFADDIDRVKHPNLVNKVFPRLRKAPKMILGRGIVNIDSLFRQTEVDYIPDTVFDKLPNLTHINSAFKSCYHLRTLPDGILKNQTKVTSALEFCYSGGLQYVPFNMFDNFRQTLHDITQCFAFSDEITSAIPDVWNKEKFPNVAQDRFYAYGCTSASNYNDIPEGWK